MLHDRKRCGSLKQTSRQHCVFSNIAQSGLEWSHIAFEVSRQTLRALIRHGAKVHNAFASPISAPMLGAPDRLPVPLASVFSAHAWDRPLRALTSGAASKASQVARSPGRRQYPGQRVSWALRSGSQLRRPLRSDLSPIDRRFCIGLYGGGGGGTSPGDEYRLANKKSRPKRGGSRCASAAG